MGRIRGRRCFHCGRDRRRVPSRASKAVPYVVEVDKLGDAIAVARADRADPADERVLKAQLVAWIVEVRSVSSDPLAQKDALSRSYAMTAATATIFLTTTTGNTPHFGSRARRRQYY